MITSQAYGPQFDPADGTIGDLQMVKRWVILDAEKQHFYPRQGRFTKETKEEADELIRKFKDSNPPHRLPKGLHAVEFWCYPGHFDPLRPVFVEEEKD